MPSRLTRDPPPSSMPWEGCARFRQEWDEAAAAYSEVLKLNPRVNAARLDLARTALARNKPDEAIQYAQEALKMQPNLADAVLIVSRAQLLKGNAAGAEADTRKLAAAFPTSPSVQTQLGQLNAAKGDEPGARRAFEAALALDANYVEALAGLAALDLRAKNPSAARARVDARVAASPNNPALLLLAARIHGATGDMPAAERALHKVIELDPNQLDAYSMLGQLYASQKRLVEARAEFERLAQLRPTTAVGAYTVVGMLLQMENKTAEAKAKYEKVMQLSPKAAVAANNLAWIYAEEGQNLDVALQLAQTAKAQLPDRPEVNDTLGWVYYKKGLATLAIPPFRDSVEKAPKSAVYQYHLGLAYAKAGDKDGARKALEAALQLDPKV